MGVARLISSIPLTVSGLTKSFGGPSLLDRVVPARWRSSTSRRITVVDQLRFEIRSREIFGVIGANGSGKSTLVRMLSTLLLPDEGEARIFGFDVVRDSRRVQRLINRVSADPSFFRSMSAADNLVFFGRIYGLRPAEVKSRSRAIFDRLGLTRRQVREPMRNLSRGQQQKVAVARAFLTSPVLMLLDEPTTGLDPRSKREVQAFIRGIRDEHDAAVLLTTHDMAESEMLCDRVAVLSGGRIVAEGTPAELRASVAGDRLGASPDMETVYMELTGRSIEEEDLLEEANAHG